MGQNNTNQIRNVVSLNNPSVAGYSFSPADDLAAIRGLTAGALLTLPSSPQSGDTYGFADVDGSCSSTHPITVAISGPGQTIQGGAAVQFATAFASATFVFDEASKSWAVTAKSASAAAGNIQSFVATTNQNFTVPANVFLLMVDAVGGGGGGGGGAPGTNASGVAQAAGGGGGAGTSAQGILNTTPGHTVAITIGAGGVAGAANAAGNPGGTTTVIDTTSNLGVFAVGGSGGNGPTSGLFSASAGGAPTTRLSGAGNVDVSNAAAGSGGNGSGAVFSFSGNDNAQVDVLAIGGGGSGGAPGVAGGGNAGGLGGGGGGAGRGAATISGAGGNAGAGGAGSAAGVGSPGGAGTAPVANSGAGGGGGGAGGNGQTGSGAGGAGGAGGSGSVRVTYFTFQ